MRTATTELTLQWTTTWGVHNHVTPLPMVQTKPVYNLQKNCPISGSFEEGLVLSFPVLTIPIPAEFRGCSAWTATDSRTVRRR